MKKQVVALLLTAVLMMGIAIIPAQAASAAENDCVYRDCCVEIKPFDYGKEPAI